MRARREAAALTQEQLASLAECSVVTLSKIETGRNVPSLEIVLALAAALETNLEDLVGWAAGSVATTKSAERDQLLVATRTLSSGSIQLLIGIAGLMAGR